ncbi:MAG: corrinoid protein [Kiritimatiellaceae bacterium]|nr:corrinoid protein [Kiritimatiellaceae bacterium]
MEELKELVKTGKRKEAAAKVQELLDKGDDPDAIMKKAMIPAMDEAGDLFQQGQYFLPEILVAAMAMKAGMEVLRPLLVKSGLKSIGTVLLATVKGDMHDIGKNLVVMAMEGAGFEVVDLGTDVSAEKFVEAIKEHKPQVIGLSALLTTTMYAMKDVIEAVDKAGLRDQVKIMIGGAPIRQEFADEIGADFCGKDSTEGKNYARDVVSKEV